MERPSHWVLFLHGILGSGQNFRGIAKQLVAARPNWGVALVDLRMHGRSQHFSPPHTVSAAAADLDSVAALLPGPVEAVLGHSFGGKVATSLALRGSQPLRHVCILDSPLGIRAGGSETTAAVLNLLHAAPPVFEHRKAFVAYATGAGQPAAVAQWLGMNLERCEGGVRLRLNIDAIQSMLDDFLQLDMWPRLPALQVPVSMLLADRSDVWSAAERARTEQAAIDGRLRLHTIPEAGHWLHVDRPEQTLQAILTELPEE